MDIGAAIRQQMLGVLIDAISKSPAAAASAGGTDIAAPSPIAPSGTRTGGLAPGVAAPLPPMQPGAQVFARVIETAPDGNALISIGDRLLTAQIAGKDLPEAARQPGATLLLRLEAAGETPRFSLLQIEPRPMAPGAPLPATTRPLDGPAPRPPAQQTGAAAAAPRDLPQVLIAMPEQAAPMGRIKPEPAAPPSLPALLQSAAAAAAPRQGSAAPLFAELAPLLWRADAPLPPAAQAVARMILDSRLDAERPISPEALKDAIQRAAVPAEALAARGDQTTPDLKTLVATLRGLLATAERRPAHETGPDAEPPRRDGSPAAIRPAPAKLEPGAEPQAAAGALAREADQAVERSRLHQLASLPDPRPAEAARQHLSFDLPLALGQQTAIAGFRIERDKRRARAPDGGPIDSWGVRFAIDADGLGPVQAHLRLTGNAVSVSLWAEESGTRQRFIEALPTLEAALAESALDIGELTILAGRPAEPRPPSGLFLDRSS